MPIHIQTIFIQLIHLSYQTIRILNQHKIIFYFINKQYSKNGFHYAGGPRAHNA